MPKKLQYSEEEQQKYQKKLEPESRPLFASMLTLPQPLGVTCAEFQQFIQLHYGKLKEVKPGHLYQWAGAPHHGMPAILKPVQKWLLAAAIDYLLGKGINPITIIPIEKVAEHWSRQRTGQLKLEEASTLFMEQFNVPIEQQNTVLNIIREVYTASVTTN